MRLEVLVIALCYVSHGGITLRWKDMLSYKTAMVLI